MGVPTGCLMCLVGSWGCSCAMDGCQMRSVVGCVAELGSKLWVERVARHVDHQRMGISGATCCTAVMDIHVGCAGTWVCITAQQDSMCTDG